MWPASRARQGEDTAQSKARDGPEAANADVAQLRQRLAQLEAAVLAGDMDEARVLCGPGDEQSAAVWLAFPRDEAFWQTDEGMLIRRHSWTRKQDEPTATVRPSSPSTLESVQAGGIVQFDTFLIFADEGEKLAVDIMRLGGLDAACSVDYETENSERWSHTCEALSGTAHFEPGERTKTVYLQFHHDSGYQCSSVEVTMKLSNPRGCTLGTYLKRIRVKLLDHGAFPTNKFAKDVKRDYTGETWRKGNYFSMLVEFAKIVYAHTKPGSRKLIVAGQVNNLIYISHLFIIQLPAASPATVPAQRFGWRLLE